MEYNEENIHVYIILQLFYKYWILEMSTLTLISGNKCGKSFI